MRTRLRTNHGDDVIVVTRFEAPGQDAAQRIPAPVVRFQLRGWLFDGDGGGRRSLLELHDQISGRPCDLRSRAELERTVLPDLARAFQNGDLVAFRLPRAQFRADLARPEEQPHLAPEPGPTDWLEIVVRQEDGEPYVGAYRLELPGGRVISGWLDAGGRVRFNDIRSGTCKVTFPQLETISLSA
jgi:hypothetical protein